MKSIKKKIVVASNLIDLYQSFGVSSASYILVPNGVDLKEFEQTPMDFKVWENELSVSLQEKVVLYIGHFYKWKGIHVLLDAASEIKARVVLIGGLEHDQKLIVREIEKRHLKNVTVLGFLPHKEIVKYLKAANVVVLPNTAKEERSARYTTPLKMFEYMASGVPIVASGIPSFRKYLRDDQNAYLFEPDNPHSLACRINYALEVDSRSIAQRALAEVKEYTWEKRAQKIVGFITKK